MIEDMKEEGHNPCFIRINFAIEEEIDEYLKEIESQSLFY